MSEIVLQKSEARFDTLQQARSVPSALSLLPGLCHCLQGGGHRLKGHATHGHQPAGGTQTGGVRRSKCSCKRQGCMGWTVARAAAAPVQVQVQVHAEETEAEAEAAL